MAHVSALFRYPVKGFTPEPMEELTVLPDGRVLGDRVFAFRFGNATGPEERKGLDYWPKAKGLSLQDFPSLARLQLSFDEGTQRVDLHDAETLLVGAVLDDAGRAELCEKVTDFVLTSAEGHKLSRPGRLPLTLVGDGQQARFQDRARGFVSLHGSASVTQLSEALGMQLDDRRFRSNIVVEGLQPSEELGWVGRVHIGDVSFEPEGPIVRCLATHANPDTGMRDASVLKTLTGALGMDKPRLGRLLLPTGLGSAGARPGSISTGFPGGVIRVGDSIEIER